MKEEKKKRKFEMNRTEFIKTCGLACLGGSVITLLLESCVSTNYFAKADLNNNKIVIKKSEFTLNENAKSTQRKYVLFKSEKFNFPQIYRFRQ